MSSGEAKQKLTSKSAFPEYQRDQEDPENQKRRQAAQLERVQAMRRRQAEIVNAEE